MTLNRYKMDYNSFLERAYLKHGVGFFNYEKVVFVDIRTSIEILCLKCENYFFQTPYNHYYYGCGCTKCFYKKIANTRKLKEFEVVEHISKSFPDKKFSIDYNEYKNVNSLLTITCNEHNKTFKQYAKHLFEAVCWGCTECLTNMSIGEKIIYNYLIINNINFEYQKTFENCRLINELRFDFYIIDINTCIEYDSEIHFKPIEHFGGDEKLKTIKIRDNIKTQYCLDNNISLCRITYKEDLIGRLSKLVKPSI